MAVIGHAVGAFVASNNADGEAGVEIPRFCATAMLFPRELATMENYWHVWIG